MLIVPYQLYIYFSIFFTTFCLCCLCCAISHVCNEFCFHSAHGSLNYYKACAFLWPEQLNLLRMPQSICDYDIQNKQSNVPCSQEPLPGCVKDWGTEQRPFQSSLEILCYLLSCFVWFFSLQKNAEWAGKKIWSLSLFIVGKYLATWEMDGLWQWEERCFAKSSSEYCIEKPYAVFQNYHLWSQGW